MLGFHTTDVKKLVILPERQGTWREESKICDFCLYLACPTSCKTKKEKRNWEKGLEYIRKQRENTLFGWKWKDDFY